MASNLLLDETNLALLSELQGDARLTLAELGRRVGLSSPAVAERVARLERQLEAGREPDEEEDG
jgi:Lrp/AsnC family leucine-responsive transcriptional regulator